MNEDRDFDSLEAEQAVKHAALRCAEAYNDASAGELDKLETLLLTQCLSRGLLSLDEHAGPLRITYDGYADEADSDAYHHVYVHLGQHAAPVLDIKCDYFKE